MKTQGKYMLGTVKEIAEAITKNILDNEGFVSRLAKRDFRNCDFGIFDSEYTREESLEYLFDTPDSGIFGIKKINTGFDNEDLDLFTDYYGGGRGDYCAIAIKECQEDCEKSILDLMLTTLNISESFDENTLIIARWVD